MHRRETLRVWDLTTGVGRTLSGHTHGVKGALLLEEARALSWSNDGTLRVWDLVTGSSRAIAGDFADDVLLLPDGRALSWSDKHTLQVWDLATEPSRLLTGHEGSVHGALLLPDARAVVEPGRHPADLGPRDRRRACTRRP
jgi:WD40 repeat protein